MKSLLGRWRKKLTLMLQLPVLDARLREHEQRIQELEKELDLGQDPSQFGNKLQRRRHLELLKDTPLTGDEQRRWESGT